MKIQKLPFFAAIMLTLGMSIIALVFHFYYHVFSEDIYLYSFALLGIAIVLAMLNYVLTDVLLRYYGKRQIKRIAVSLPKEFQDSDTEGLDFDKFGEKVSQISQKTTEIDTMKEMENYRKEYIGNIAHELKTPLFSIQGYVETLLDGGVENLTIRDKYLQRIESSVERLLNIVKDLDMINRYEVGEIQLKMSDFDINALSLEVLELFDLEAEKTGAQLQLLSSDKEMWVHADKQKISQVLINLISNAIHYSNRENAQIVIKTGVLKSKIYVQVSDNGMGIKPEVLPRIFERFYRVESSRSRREGGSGLGLAIVKHILEAHGQSIRVESEYLEGTTFTFLLEKKEVAEL